MGEGLILTVPAGTGRNTPPVHHRNLYPYLCVLTVTSSVANLKCASPLILNVQCNTQTNKRTSNLVSLWRRVPVVTVSILTNKHVVTDTETNSGNLTKHRPTVVETTDGGNGELTQIS